ncbi:histidine kinase [Streptomyces sp. 4N124]|uniref:histidine kinase n=1 Tax=Streptomyces sp. 4N124 TaxID=3457420 RepID=UPI003FCF06B0
MSDQDPYIPRHDSAPIESCPIDAACHHDEKQHTSDAAAQVAAERRRLADLLHDILTCDLVVIASLSEQLRAAEGETAPELPTAIADASRRALDSLRQFIGPLRRDRPADTDRRAPADFAALLHTVGSRPVEGLLGITAEADDPSAPLPGRHRPLIERMVLESLANAVKHNPGGTFSMHLVSRPSLVVRTCSLPPSGGQRRRSTPWIATSGTGSGLARLEAEFREAGGELTVLRSKHGRLDLTASLPWRGSTAGSGES